MKAIQTTSSIATCAALLFVMPRLLRGKRLPVLKEAEIAAEFGRESQRASRSMLFSARCRLFTRFLDTQGCLRVKRAGLHESLVQQYEEYLSSVRGLFRESCGLED